MKTAKARMNAKWAAIKERIQPAPRSVRNEVTRRAQVSHLFALCHGKSVVLTFD